MKIKNARIKRYEFLAGMYKDGYFPDFLVDKIKHILLDLCEKIEEFSPKTQNELLSLTHLATEGINHLEEKFEENESELETEASEAIGEDFEFIVRAYGFDSVDIEDVIASRTW